MKNSVWLVVASAIAWFASSVAAAPWQALPPLDPSQNPMLLMEQKEKKFTEPGPAHKQLERILGKWTTETSFFVFDQPTEPEKGTAEFSWQLKGRWLKCAWTGQLGGKPAESLSLIGYDNFRKNYIMTTVSSWATAMTSGAGDMDAEGGRLTFYGVSDDYMSDEPDRMTRYVLRLSPDKLVWEEYDLQLGGETGSKVLQTVYTRVK